MRTSIEIRYKENTLLPVYPPYASLIHVFPSVLSLSVLETSMLLWPCSSALLILCAMHVLLMYLSFCPSRSTMQQCCPTPALQSRANAAPPGLRTTSQGKGPQARSCLSLPPTTPAALLLARPTPRIMKISVLFVMTSFRNDDVVTVVHSPHIFPVVGPSHVRSNSAHAGRGEHAPPPRPAPSVHGD